MTYILNQLKKWAHLKGVLIAFGVFMVTSNLINGGLVGVKAMKRISNGIGILDLEPGYSVERAYSMLDKMGALGRQFYATHIIPMDMVFPLTYGIAFSLAILYFVLKLMPNNEPAQGLIYIPLAAMLSDYLENVCVILVLIKYPEQLPGIIQMSNLFTMIKSALLGFSILMVVLSLMILLIKNGAGKMGLGKKYDE